MSLEPYIEKLHPFSRMVVGAVMGSFLGIFFGLLFSLLISFISQSLAQGNMNLGSPTSDYGAATFLGMGFGAIIGAIMGGALYSRQK